MLPDGDLRDALTLERYLAPITLSDELRLSVGVAAEGHVPLVALPDEQIDTWLADMGHDHPDMDDKTRAAYLIGHIAWSVALNIGALHVAGPGVPAVDSAIIGMASAWYRYDHEGESGHALRFTPRLLAAPADTFRPLDSAGIHALILAVHAPLIEQLFVRTRLGRKAMWRLVADAVAAGWLAVGKQIDRDAHAMALAEAIMATPGSPLANKQTHYVDITVPDEGDGLSGHEWFRARGGCCRYYTTEKSAGEYCTTCVLRTPESRNALLQTYLRNKLTAA